MLAMAWLYGPLPYLISRTGSVSRTGSTIFNEITRDYVNIVHGEAVWTF